MDSLLVLDDLPTLPFVVWRAILVRWMSKFDIFLKSEEFDSEEQSGHSKLPRTMSVGFEDSLRLAQTDWIDLEEVSGLAMTTLFRATLSRAVLSSV